MDVSMLDEGCRRFSSRVLAAAVMFGRFEPVALIEQVTGERLFFLCSS